MLRVGVIGYSYWGPKLVRNLAAVAGAQVVAVCDKRTELLNHARTDYPTVRTSQDPDELFADKDIDAVAIATPVAAHFDLSHRALEANKHVWIEKPMTATADQAASLVDTARRTGRILFVDHTYLYTGAARKIHELLTSGALGKLYYYDSVRVNLGVFQNNVNVLWDLAVHDLALIDYLFAERPVAISATGMSHLLGQPESVAYLTLFFPDRQVAHVHVNWLAPVKVRRTLIGGSEKMVLWDDLEPSEKVKVYDKGIQVSDTEESLLNKRIGYRTGDMWAPQLERTEALLKAAEHFVHCIQQNKTPISDGAAGLRVVRLLEAATRSMRQRGQQVEL